MDKYLKEIVVCPLCKGQLQWQKKTQELVCAEDKLAFPVREGIPVMLVQEARRVEEV